MTAREARAQSDRIVRIGLLGSGNVGAAVIRLLYEHADDVSRKAGVRLEIARVAVREPGRDRALPLPLDRFTDDPAAVVDDPGIDIVCELMGGVDPARQLLLRALASGKSVVTANKELLASHGEELFSAADRAGGDLYFEAAVAGGIPLIRPLRESLAGERVDRILGIVNGTTNFILTQMSEHGWTSDQAVAEAQRLGFAEADPTADVEGGDAADKLVILARLAFGIWLDRGAVVTARPGEMPGITGVTAEALEAARERGLAIRLLASATRADDGTVDAHVLASEVPSDSPLGQTHGVRNRIEIESDRLGWIGIEGPGAGGAATAAAVLADLAAIAAGGGSTWGALPPATSAVSVG